MVRPPGTAAAPTAAIGGSGRTVGRKNCANRAAAFGPIFAFAVSRLLCSPEIPTWEELAYYLEHGSEHHALRHDEAINHVHRATTRRGHWDKLMALAFDHRAQFEEMADRLGVSRDKDRAAMQSQDDDDSA